MSHNPVPRSPVYVHSPAISFAAHQSRPAIPASGAKRPACGRIFEVQREKVDGAVNYRKITMNVRKTLCSPSCIGGDTTVREANPATISSAHKGTGHAETTPLQLRGYTQHRELEREGHFATRAPEHTAEALHAPRGPGTSRSKSSAKFPEVPARNALRNVRETVGP
jgi:hypothetical protein